MVRNSDAKFNVPVSGPEIRYQIKWSGTWSGILFRCSVARSVVQILSKDMNLIFNLKDYKFSSSFLDFLKKFEMV